MLSVVFLVHTERADQVEVRQRIMLIDFFACFHVIISRTQTFQENHH